MDLLSRKAPFDLVKEDPKALQFHIDRYERGAIDKLARFCYQYSQLNQKREQAK